MVLNTGNLLRHLYKTFCFEYYLLALESYVVIYQCNNINWYIIARFKFEQINLSIYQCINIYACKFRFLSCKNGIGWQNTLQPCGLKLHVESFWIFTSEDGIPVKDKAICQLFFLIYEQNKFLCAFGTTLSKQIYATVKNRGMQGQSFRTITANATKGVKMK